MITRYFSPSPRAMGPLEFLAGFGQQRHRVKAAEAGMEMQQGQALSQGIAGAGQGIAQGISQSALAQFQAGQQTEQQAARALMLQGLQQQRTQGGAWQDANEAYIKAGGALGQPPPGMGPSVPTAGGPPPAAPQAVAQPPGAMMGPPGPSQAQTFPIEVPPPLVPAEPAGVPLPAIEPSAIPQYREAVRKRDQLMAYKATIDTDPYMPPEEKARKIAALAPHIAASQAFLKKNPRPKPPRTYEELVAAGPHGGGLTPVPGMLNAAISDGKGGTKYSTALHLMPDTGWMAEPDPVKRAELKQASLEDHLATRGDDEYLWDGKQKWDKQKEERDEFDRGRYFEKRMVPDKDTGKIPSAPTIVKEISQIESGLELMELQQAVQEAPNADAILKLVQNRARISPETYERMDALLQTADTRSLTPNELRERGELAEEWLDGLAALKDTGVQIPEHMKADLLKQKDLFRSYVAAGQQGQRW